MDFDGNGPSVSSAVYGERKLKRFAEEWAVLPKPEDQLFCPTCLRMLLWSDQHGSGEGEVEKRVERLETMG